VTSSALFESSYWWPPDLMSGLSSIWQLVLEFLWGSWIMNAVRYFSHNSLSPAHAIPTRRLEAFQLLHTSLNTETHHFLSCPPNERRNKKPRWKPRNH
jgi:hypothetical protein